MAERKFKKLKLKSSVKGPPPKAINKKINKIFIWLGVASAIIGIVIIATVILYIFFGNLQDKESKAYVDQAVPAIVAHWDKQQLEDRADSQLLAATTPEQIDEIFKDSAIGLGPMVKYVGSNGESGMNFHFDNTTLTATTTANYIAHVLFQKRYIDIKVTLIKRDNKWYIYGFFVDPPTSSN